VWILGCYQGVVSLTVDVQWRFASLVAHLILEANRLGYNVTLGEAWRHPVMAAWYAARGKGVRESFHTKRLAIDLQLFRDSVYLTSTEDYTPLGVWWEAQGGTWGGRFKRADGNHFSLGE